MLQKTRLSATRISVILRLMCHYVEPCYREADISQAEGREFEPRRPLQ